MKSEHTNITCPDCNGALERLTDGKVVQYRCRVGHTYSPLTALATHNTREENALWSAVVALEEGADMGEEIAQQMPRSDAENLRQEASRKRELAQAVRKVVTELPTVQTITTE